MSDIAITVQTINSVEPHPNADRLEIARVLGAQTLVTKGEYKAGDRVIYFPPDMMIPEAQSEALGVKNYLKHAMWGDKRLQCKIAACRIRGIPSYGFVTPCMFDVPVGHDLTDFLGGEKYEPPAIGTPGVCKGLNPNALPEGKLHRYTNIQHFWRYPNVFEPDEEVVLTEKVHGSNSRVGVIFEDDEWVYAAGSHRVRWKEAVKGADRYWNPLRNESMLNMLADLCRESADVVVFGEIYGSSVQDMDYGIDGDDGYRVFDISINGTYLDWDSVVRFCNQNGVATVPVLYEGPWKAVAEVIDQYSSGRTCVGKSRGKFKDREGIVIKPVTERLTDRIGGSRQPHRAIVKYVSADYLDRKDAQDNA